MNDSDLRAQLDLETPVIGADLAAISWPDLHAEEAEFVECSFDRPDFMNVVFANAIFRRCRFVRPRFAHADLHGARFEDCVAIPWEGEAARFAFSDLRHVKLHRCDLSLARFTRSDLFGVEMEDCKLSGAVFDQVDFSQPAAGRGRGKAIITQAAFRRCNLSLADLSGAGLAGADFTASHLREADFSGADFSGADLRDYDLTQAALEGTSLTGADLRGADIGGIDLLTLGSFKNLRIDANQQHIVLSGLGIDVHPGPVRG